MIEWKRIAAWLVLAPAVGAQSTSWLGVSSPDWHDANNWSNGVPDASLHADVGFGAFFDPFLDAGAECASLSVPFGLLTLGPSGVLDVYGDASSQGIFGPGVVRTRGAGVATVTGVYDNLEVFDGPALLDGARVDESLTVSQATGTLDGASAASTVVSVAGTLVALGSSDLGVLEVAGSASVEGGCVADSLSLLGGELTLTALLPGPAPVSIAGSVQNAGGVVVNDSGAALRITGSGELTGALPALELASGEHHLFDLTLGGDLLQTSGAGTALVRDVWVQGSATFLGGDVQDDGPSSVLTIDGDAVWDNGVLVHGPPRLIVVGGSWSSTAAFEVLVAGRRIRMVGGGTRQLGALGQLSELEVDQGTTLNALGHLTVRDLVQVNAGCALVCDELESLASAVVQGELVTLAGGSHELHGSTVIDGVHSGTGELVVFDDYTVTGTSREAEFRGPGTIAVTGELVAMELNPGTEFGSAPIVIEGGGVVGPISFTGYQARGGGLPGGSSQVTLRDVTVGNVFAESANLVFDGDVTAGLFRLSNTSIETADDQAILRTTGFVFLYGSGPGLAGAQFGLLELSVVEVNPTNGFGTQGGVVRFGNQMTPETDAQGGSGSPGVGNLETNGGGLSLGLGGTILIEDGYGVGFGYEQQGSGGLPVYAPPGALGPIDIVDGSLTMCPSCPFFSDPLFSGSPYKGNSAVSLTVRGAGAYHHDGPHPISIPGGVLVEAGGVAELGAATETGSLVTEPGSTLGLVPLVSGGYPESDAFAVSDLVVSGDLRNEGALVNPAGIGATVTGVGALSGDLPPLTIEGEYGFASAVVLGPLFHESTAGPLDLASVPGTTVLVSGDVLLDGAEVGATAADGVLDVEGALDWQPAATSGVPAVVRVAGDASFDAGFVPAPGGLLVLDGPPAPGQALAHVGNVFQSVEVAAGAQVTTNALRADDHLGVLGSLTLTDGALIAGDLELGVGGQLDLQAAAPVSHGVGGDLVVPAGAGLSVPSDAFLTLTGAGARVVDADPSQLLPIVNITAGSTTMPSLRALILVTQVTAGSLEVGEVVVENDCAVRGTTFSGAGPGSVFDVALNLQIIPGQPSRTPPETIRVGHRLDVNGNFLPTSGTVELVGPAIQAIRAIEGAAEVRLHDLHVKGGTRTAEAPLVLNSLAIDAGSVLEAQPGGSIRVAAGQSVVVDGTLRLPGGADLLLGAGASLRVGPTGRLDLLGVPGDRSEVLGDDSSILLEGALGAQHFAFAGMDAAGVRIASTATLDPAPNDLRGGLFLGGRPGGVQLDLSTVAPVTLVEPDFVSAGTGVAVGLRSTTAVPILVEGALGDVAGEAYEDDPNGVISWSAPLTQVEAFDAVGRVQRVLLSFTTSAEEPAMPPFRILRDELVPVGPDIPAVGPSTYSTIDTGLPVGVSYLYTLQYESPLTGAWRWLAEDTATPHADVVGKTYFVGPGGFTDVDAALSLAPADGTVFVEAGVYSGFTVTQPARVVGDSLGSAVFVGTPVSVVGVSTPTGAVLLDGLEVQSSLQVSGVLDPLLLHGVVVSGGGDPGTVVSGSPQVALQRFETSRRVDVSSSGLSSWGGTFGVVDLSAGSVLQHVDTSPSAVIQVDGSSTSTPKSAGWSTVDAPRSWPLGSLVELAFGGVAGEIYLALYSPGLGHLDLGAVTAYDMPLLLALAPPLQSLTGGFLLPDGQGGGAASFAVTVPAAPALAGTAYHLQVLGYDALAGTGRFGESVPLILVP